MKRNKTTFKQKLNSDKKMKRIFFGIIGLMCVSLISAGWMMTFQGSSGYIISSDEIVNFQSFLSMDAVDFSESSHQKTDLLNLTNSNGEIDMTLSIEEIIQDIDDDCDPTDDCSVLVEFQGVEVIDQEILTIPTGNSKIEVTTDCIRMSCPQNFSTEISMNAN